MCFPLIWLVNTKVRSWRISCKLVVKQNKVKNTKNEKHEIINNKKNNNLLKLETPNYRQ